jgi:hypothetical protein
MTRMDITAVLTLHEDGPGGHIALLSLLRAAEAARAASLSVEAMLLLDRPDAATRAYAAALREPGLTVREADADCGMLARNAATEAARGAFLAFLDPRGRWCEGWLLHAHEAARNAGAEAAWHPEATLWPDAAEGPHWEPHEGADTLGWDWETLALRDHWTALSFAPRALHLRLPYRPGAWPGWSWNMDVAAAGVPHRIVRATAHVMRGEPERAALPDGRLPAPSSLFRRRTGGARLRA